MEKILEHKINQNHIDKTKALCYNISISLGEAKFINVYWWAEKDY